MATSTSAVATKAPKYITKMVAVREPPKLGRKQVFLPNFTLTLVRTPKLPPTTAAFIVPLNLNKLDLRDYLWNGYGVRVKGVRSYIQQQKLRQDKPASKRPSQRQWFRPRSIKKMLVELEEPFAWPDEPEDFSLWDKAVHDAANEDQKEFTDSLRPDAKTKPKTEEIDAFETQALDYLGGKKRWSPMKNPLKEDAWEDVGEEVEVETNLEVPKS